MTRGKVNSHLTISATWVKNFSPNADKVIHFGNPAKRISRLLSCCWWVIPSVGRHDGSGNRKVPTKIGDASAHCRNCWREDQRTKIRWSIHKGRFPSFMVNVGHLPWRWSSPISAVATWRSSWKDEKTWSKLICGSDSIHLFNLIIQFNSNLPERSPPSLKGVGAWHCRPPAGLCSPPPLFVDILQIKKVKLNSFRWKFNTN